MLKHIRIFSVVSFCLFSNIIISEISDSQKQVWESLPPDQRESIIQKMNKADGIQKEINDTFDQNNTLIERPQEN